jgi:hypothetical protein
LESDSLLDKKVKKVGKVWKISEKKPIFATSNVCFDYAAECGEQDLIDTTPFESHLRVAFTFSYLFRFSNKRLTSIQVVAIMAGYCAIMAGY